MIDFMNIIARRKLAAGDEWEWVESEAITGGFLLTGSASKINAQGNRTWAKPRQKVLITMEEIEVEKQEHERETGKCAHCEGTTQEVCGYSRDEGARYRPCKRCNATGIPIVAVVTE